MNAMREGDNCPRCGASASNQDKQFHCITHVFTMNCRSCRYEWKYKFPSEPKSETEVFRR